MAGENDVEDEVAELVTFIAEECVMMDGPTDALKRQFRDALVKLIDERIRIAQRPAIR